MAEVAEDLTRRLQGKEEKTAKALAEEFVSSTANASRRRSLSSRRA